MDIEILSRIQFALNISFHILFPSITIGLAWCLLFFKLVYLKTGNKIWLDSYFLWTKIFALCFALGVVTGITMSFQFGTNWPGFMKTVGNIAGPLLGYEVLTAFFLEASFLSIMLFGIKRVKPWVHNLATFLVALGTTLSAFWILVLNGWMQTPVGFEMINGQAFATDWIAIIFNPSMPYRFSHTMLSSFLTAAFLIAGISAYQLLKIQKINTPTYNPKIVLKFAIYLAAIITPLQMLVGHMHGENTLEHQPEKIAAIEALWETQPQPPLVLFAIPDEKNKKNHLSIEIPKALNWTLTGNANAQISGLDQFSEHPPVFAAFWSFRIMVGVGILMLLFSWIGVWQIHKKRINRWFLKLLTTFSFSGWVAVLAGWYVAEIGRQPWLVTGVLKTKDAVTHVSSTLVGTTLVLYALLYAFLLTVFLTTLFYMSKKTIDSQK